MSKEYDKSILENEDYKKAIKEYNEKLLEKYDINYETFDENSPVFFRRPESLEESIFVCKQEGIDYKNGSIVLTRSPEDIKRIIGLCQNFEIPYNNASIFKSDAEQLKAILEVCNKHNIRFNSFMLDFNPSHIDANANYIKENYGSMYLHPLALVQDCERVREVFPYLEEKGYLDCINGGSAMLTLPLNELKERESVLRTLGEDGIVNGKVNDIFALSNEKYQEKYKNTIDAVKNGQFAGGTKK